MGRPRPAPPRLFAAPTGPTGDTFAVDFAPDSNSIAVGGADHPALPVTSEQPWEILAGDVVRYVRPDGTDKPPSIIPAHTLRTSPTWRKVQ